MAAAKKKVTGFINTSSPQVRRILLRPLVPPWVNTA